jgi:hypothetical protein
VEGRLTARYLHALTPLFRTHVNPYGRLELDMDAGLDLSGPEMAARDRGVGSGPQCARSDQEWRFGSGQVTSRQGRLRLAETAGLVLPYERTSRVDAGCQASKKQSPRGSILRSPVTTPPSGRPPGRLTP